MDRTVPRGWLGASAGVFSLDESDFYCGSYLTVDDAARILEIAPASLSHLRPVKHADKEYVTDQQLGRAWADGTLDSPRRRFQRGDARISFDELILITLVELTLPKAVIEPQLRVGQRLVDLRISYGGKMVAVEFFGPYHFIRRSPRQKSLVDPRIRRKELEYALGHECVIWPYWVQRCASNLRTIFDQSSTGIGSIWSTSAHFGDFDFADAAQIIVDLNARFGIERPDGVGYMYTDELVTKPTHPIVKRIRTGRENTSKLVPPGSAAPANYWLPRTLWSLVRR